MVHAQMISDSCDTFIPFRKENQLFNGFEITGESLSLQDKTSHLPGQPYVSLDPEEVLAYLANEYITPLLDQFAPRLWLLAPPSSSHIFALHSQTERRREIVITEDPELHLILIGSRVFIKPIPPFLLSHVFWQYYWEKGPSQITEKSSQKSSVFAALLGYLRSYRYLLCHESDYQIAAKVGLIPQGLTWIEIATFLKTFEDVPDSRVSPRYRYGELSLTRLNFWAKFCLHRWQFRKSSWHYTEYMVRFYAPAFFVSGVMGVALSAMQVGLTARPSWGVFRSVSAGFSVASLYAASLVTAGFVGALAFTLGRELLFALSRLFRLKREHH